MKNLTLGFFLLSFLTSTFAQPSITSDWFYAIGDTVRINYFVPDAPTPPQPEEGVNLIWDFSKNIAWPKCAGANI